MNLEIKKWPRLSPVMSWLQVREVSQNKTNDLFSFMEDDDTAIGQEENIDTSLKSQILQIS